MRLILKNGLTIENGRAGLATGSLVLYFSGYTMAQAAALMIDHPEITGKIIFQYGEDEDVYTGYTDCSNLGRDEDGEITVILEWEARA